MTRFLWSALAVAAGLLLGPSPAGAVDPAKDILGTWEGASGAGGFKEVWTIERDKNGWSVKGVFKKGDDEVGAFTGKNPQFAQGTLTFVQQYSQKPNPGWSDGNVMQAKAAGDKLTVVWRAARNSGTVTLTRAGEPKPKDDMAVKPKDPKTTPDPKTDPKKDPGTGVAVKPKDPAPEPKKGDPKAGRELAMVGTWEADVMGIPDLKEIWKIEQADGKWGVKGVFVQKNVTIGAFHGERVTLVAGELTFSQKYDVKPFPDWKDGSPFFVKPGDGNVEGKLAVTNNRKAFPRLMTRSDAELTAVAPKKKDDAGKVELTAEAKKELGTLSGQWLFTVITFDGMKIDFKASWTIGEGTIIEHLGGDKTFPRRNGTVNVDPGKSPKTIEINFTKSTGGPTGKYRGIYEVKDGVLTLCVSGTDDPAPTDFTSKPGSKALLMTLKPAKK